MANSRLTPFQRRRAARLRGLTAWWPLNCATMGTHATNTIYAQEIIGANTASGKTLGKEIADAPTGIAFPFAGLAIADGGITYRTNDAGTSGGVDQYLLAGSDPLNGGTYAQLWSTAFWFNATYNSSVDGDSRLICWEANVVIWLEGSVNNSIVGCDINSGTNGNRISSTLLNNVWQHVVVTYDNSGVNSGIKIYINGVLASAGGVPAGNSGTAGNWGIGCRSATERHTTGQMADVMQFTGTLLSAAEVADLYNSYFITEANPIEQSELPKLPVVSPVVGRLPQPYHRLTPRRSVPRGGRLSIDWTHPLAQGLIGCWVPGVSAGINLTGMGADMLPSAAGNVQTWADGPEGAAWQTAKTGDGFAITGPPSVFVGQINSLYWRGIFTGTIASNAGSPLIGLEPNNTGGGPFLYQAIDVVFGSGGAICCEWNSGGSFAQSGTSFVPTINTMYGFAGTFKPGGNSVFYVNGSAFNTTAYGASGPTTNGTPRLDLQGFLPDLTRTLAAQCFIACQWNRELSADEVKAFDADPYCFLVSDLEVEWAAGPVPFPYTPPLPANMSVMFGRLPRSKTQNVLFPSLQLQPNRLGYPGTLPGFDVSHPASEGIGVSAVVVSGALPLEIIKGTLFTSSGAAQTPVQSVVGPALYNAGTGYANGGVSNVSFAKITQACIFVPQALSTSGLTGIVSATILYIYGASGGTAITYLGGIRDSGVQLVVGRPYFFASSYSNDAVGTLNQIVKDLQTGQITTNVQTIGPSGGLANSNYCFGGDGAGAASNSQIAATMYSTSFLSMEQLRQWADDPWSFWYPSEVEWAAGPSLVPSVVPPSPQPSLLLGRLPWPLHRPTSRKSVPRGGKLSIDWTHPLTQGLIGCWVPGLSGGLDLAGNFQDLSPINATGNVVIPAVDAEGPGYKTTNVGDGLRNSSFPASLRLTTQGSVYWRGTFQSSTSAGVILVGSDYDSSGTPPYVGFGLQTVFGGGAGPQVNLVWNNGGSTLNTTFGTATVGPVNSWGGTFLSFGNALLYQNGVQIQSSSLAGGLTIGYGTTPRVVVCAGYTDNTRVLGATTFLACKWNRALSAAEMALLDQDPYCFLQSDLEVEWAAGPVQPPVPPPNPPLLLGRLPRSETQNVLFPSLRISTNKLNYPGGKAGVDSSHPASVGLLMSAVADVAAANYVDVATGSSFSVTAGNVSANPVDGVIGPTIQATTGDRSTHFRTYLPFSTTLPAVTCACIVVPTASSSLHGIAVTPGGGGSGFYFGPTGITVFGGYGGGAFSFTPTVGHAYFVAESLLNTAGGGVNAVIKDLTTGQLVTNATTHSSVGTNFDGADIYVGNDGTGYTSNTLCAVSMCSTAFLSLDQLVAWSEDPWSFWYLSESEWAAGPVQGPPPPSPPPTSIMFGRLPWPLHRLTPRKHKPQGNVSIDWSHPLTNGLASYWYDTGQGFYIDLVTGDTTATETTRSVDDSPFGPAFSCTVSSTNAINSRGLFQAQTLAAPFSFATGWYQKQAPVSLGTYFGILDNSGVQSWVAYANGTQLNSGFYNSSASTFTATATNNVYYTMVGTAVANNSQTSYLLGTDGTNETKALSAPTPNSLTTGRASFGSYQTVSGNSGAFIYYGAYWRRVLSADEAALLHADPFCFLQSDLESEWAAGPTLPAAPPPPVITVTWGFDIQSFTIPPTANLSRFKMAGLLAGGDTGTEAQYTYVPPAQIPKNWGQEPILPMLIPVRQGQYGKIRHKSEFAIWPNPFPEGWQIQPWQPPNPINFDKRTAATMIGETGIEAKYVFVPLVSNLWGQEPVLPILTVQSRLTQPGIGSTLKGEDIEGPYVRWRNWADNVLPMLSNQGIRLQPGIGSTLKGEDIEGPYARWRNWGWETQPVQPPALAYVARYKFGTLAKWQDGTLPYLLWMNGGWEVQPVQPPNPRPERWGGLARGDDGNENIYQFFTAPIINVGFEGVWVQPPHPRSERSGLQFGGDTGIEYPEINWINHGWPIASHQPQTPRPELSGMQFGGDSGIEYPQVSWSNPGWHIQPPQPPNPRPERAGAVMRGDEGNENTYQFFTAPVVLMGFEGVWPQPPHLRAEKWGTLARGDEGIEGIYRFWINGGAWEIQPPQPPHPRPEKWASLTGSDQGDEAIEIVWRNFGWEIQSVQPPNPRPEKAGSIMPIETGIEAQYVFTPVGFVTWGFEPTNQQTRVRYERAGSLMRGDEGIEGPYFRWINGGWEIAPHQPQYVRWENWAALLYGDPGMQGIYARWRNFGWEIQPPQPPRFSRARSAGWMPIEQGIEAKFTFVPPPAMAFYQTPNPDMPLRRPGLTAGAMLAWEPSWGYTKRSVAVFYACTHITSMRATVSITYTSAITNVSGEGSTDPCKE
jgi:Concanavalin A-like lectin/glucanases superfamily